MYKIDFWNVAGIKNKDEDFREKLKRWDVMFLSETWLQKKDWEGVQKLLPKGYVWEVQEARRRNKKGRTMGGMIVGVREEIGRETEFLDREEKGLQVVKVNLGAEWWRLVGVYVNGDLEEKMRCLRKWMEDGEIGVRVLVGHIWEEKGGR